MYIKGMPDAFAFHGRSFSGTYLHRSKTILPRNPKTSAFRVLLVSSLIYLTQWVV